MKITDKINNLETSQPFYSFEYFPPKTDEVSIERTFISLLSIL